MLLPIQSSTNANGSHGNNNNNGNDIDDNDNNEPNHQKGHFIPPFIITTINHMNHFDHNSILLNHVVSSHDHTSTISTNTAATADKNENNLVIRSHHRNHLRSNTPATIDMNHIFEQKETRIQLRKLHTESGEYELGSLIGESHEDLHCSDVKTDSSENTIEKDKKEEVNLLSQSQSNINIIKASQKSFNSLPVHQRNNELAMTPPKSRPEFPVQWSVNTANTENIETDQKNPDESNASFNLDVLTKVYSNSERLAQFNISTSNTNDYSNTTTKYAYSVFTENSDYNGCNNYHRDTLKKGRISNEIVDCKKRNEIIQNESLESHSPVEQIRYWRSVAAAAQASAAGQWLEQIN
ncbi:unnamed protein product [Heterobilharzia americana]|nr:unnamed protein product [Heterobilharzia americana]